MLTVPASFDESARELTRESAMGAGLNPDSLLFLEEPQAALYAWLAEKGDQWREDLKVGDVVFVCDIGGGTTDLSMIRVEEEEGDLVLRRLAVGRRLLLGGDNIDLALAYKASELFAREGIKLDPWQSTSLQRQCRLAKEKFLKGETTVADDALKITIAGRSSRAIAGAVSIDLPEKDAVSIILDGFFPICSLEDRPKARSVMGLREIGLPYESDPAFSRHIARFLSSCLDENGEPIAPTHFLLNGGVFRASLARKRFQEQLSVWFPQNEPRDLSPDADLERAVSRGAAYYGAMKQIGGVRIRSASARSYYVGIEVAGLAVPGATLPLKLLCIVPQGMEEGTEILASSDEFELVVGETAIFRFFSSTSRTRDKPGDVFLWREENDESDFEETDPIETILELDSSTLSDASNESFVTVRFRSVLTELGVLEIWCDETNGSRSWKLEFSVREERRS